MSEPIGMSIKIGGDLPESLIEEFLSTINNDISDIAGPTSENELREQAGEEPIYWYGISNYGLCDHIKAFCRKHGLGYQHYCDATYGYEASSCFWIPGMKKEEFPTSKINIYDIKPICDLMLAVIKDGDKALPLFIDNKHLVHIVEKSLKNPKKLHELLVKEANRLLLSPTIPELPVFRII